MEPLSHIAILEDRLHRLPLLVRPVLRDFKGH